MASVCLLVSAVLERAMESWGAVGQIRFSLFGRWQAKRHLSGRPVPGMAARRRHCHCKATT